MVDEAQAELMVDVYAEVLKEMNVTHHLKITA